jgi:hypothetical protein
MAFFSSSQQLALLGRKRLESEVARPFMKSSAAMARGWYLSILNEREGASSKLCCRRRWIQFWFFPTSLLIDYASS